MASKLIALTISFIAFYHTIAPGCENCGCCVNNTCARAFIEGADRDDVCTYGCIDGYGGNKCYNKCPDDCVTCEQTYHKNCTTCGTGKYLTKNAKDKRCVDCPTRCKTCTSSTQCQECNPPYYNDIVIDCSLLCPEKCASCSDQDTCQYCKDGYYNGRAYDISDRDEISDCSLSCRENCTRCNSYNQCTHCTDGKYGAYCQNTCSVGCMNGNCAIGYGSCQCKDGFTGLTCSECVTGRYGETCNKLCPSTCKDKNCNKNTGQCFSCQLGSFGIVCEHNCSAGCKNSECDFETGSCIECVPTYSGNKCCIQNGFCNYCSLNTVCETCTHGYYGNRCNKACPAMCKMIEGEALCERTSGICTACADGFYGDFCNSACSNQCLNNRCVKDNGRCSEGCLNGYEGPTCAVLVNNSNVGMAVGISSAVTIVIVTISIFISFIILRKWFRNVHDILRQHHEPNIQASYMNTELQSIPAETVQSVGNNDQCDDMNYEELNECNLKLETADYNQIHA